MLGFLYLRFKNSHTYTFIYIYINYLFDTSVTLIKKSIYQIIKLLPEAVNFLTISEQKFIILTNQ